MRPLVTSLQGRLVVVYFGCRKLKKLLSRIRFVVSMHVPEMIGGAEERPRFCSRKWTASMDETLEATGRVGLWIHLGLLTISETCRQPLPKREGTYKSSHRFACGDHGGGEVTFLYSEDPYLASQNNVHRTTLRFRRHLRISLSVQQRKFGSTVFFWYLEDNSPYVRFFCSFC